MASQAPGITSPISSAAVLGPTGLFSRYWITYLTALFQQCTLILDQTLTVTGPTTIKGPVVTEGQTLIEIVRQDSTGGRKIAWDGTFNNAPVDIDVTASTETIYTFVGHNGKWLFLYANPGQPLSA